MGKTVILAEFTGWGAGLSDGWRGEGGKMPFYGVLLKKPDLAGCGAGWWLLPLSGGDFGLFVVRAEKAETAHRDANGLKTSASPFQRT